ncbi:MAG TPA: hypothetical protein DEO59_04165 [Balneola sp.]|nr:hypothetical protein [Balneola sp.]
MPRQKASTKIRAGKKMGEGTKKIQIQRLEILKMNKYPKEDINAMRETLHESEWEGLKDRDLRLILWEGCVGWENMSDEEVVEQYENIYGETENVEIVICDKALHEGQGHIIARFNDIK